MLSIIEAPVKTTSTIPMCAMKPLQVAQIHRPGRILHRTYVMRTASNTAFEIINLSNPGIDQGWTHPIPMGTPIIDIPVRLLGPGEKLTIELSN